MTRYQVNATISFPAWIEVEADSPEEAIEEASNSSAGLFDYDATSPDLDFNVTPEVEVA